MYGDNKSKMNILRIPKNRLLQYLQVQFISVVNLFLFVWFVKAKFDKVEFCFQILYKPIYIKCISGTVNRTFVEHLA